MLAVGGQVGVVAARVVEGQALLGVADRPGGRALVEGGAGQQLGCTAMSSSPSSSTSVSSASERW